MTTLKDDVNRAYWDEMGDSGNFDPFGDKGCEELFTDYLSGLDSDLHVAELGCGTGKFLDFLSGKFRDVTAIDFSGRMLKEASERNVNSLNISYHQDDMRDLRSHYNAFDLVVTNSVLPSTIKEGDQILGEIYKSLKDGGHLVTLLPSADTCIYLAILTLRDHLDKGLSEEEAVEKINYEFSGRRSANRYAFLWFLEKGPESKIKERYFYGDEIPLVMKDIGFEIQRLEKYHYSWEHTKKHNYGYFPGKPGIYDYFVVATKPEKNRE